jgi:hypothetical protein
MIRFFQSFIFLPLIIAGAVLFVLERVKSKAPIAHEIKTYPIKAVKVIHAKKSLFARAQWHLVM